MTLTDVAFECESGHVSYVSVPTETPASILASHTCPFCGSGTDSLKPLESLQRFSRYIY